MHIAVNVSLLAAFVLIIYLWAIRREDAVLVVSLMVIVMLLVFLWATIASAADDATCNRYGRQIEALVMELTNDSDIAQAAGYSGAIHCGVIDYPPAIDLGYETETPSVPATTIATKTSDSVPAPLVKKPVAPKPDPVETAWRAACAKRYKSFDQKDETVIPAGKRKRVPCPIPRG